MAVLPGFVGPSYTLRSVNAACQRSVNLYPEPNEMAQGAWHLISTPGLRKISTLGSGPFRGMHKAANGRAFAVSGNGLYEITDATNPALLGTGDTYRGAVKFADTAGYLVFVDGVHGYYLDFTTNVLAQITDPDFPVATSVAFLDQYIIVNDEGSGRFQFSALNDPIDWDGLDVATAEGSPDNLIALGVDHREIILFGDLTTEVWYDSGGALDPFQRINGAFIEHGIAGKYLHALMDNTRLWWSKDANGHAMAVRMNGYQAQRVSTFAVEEAVQGYGDISSGTCFAYQAGGHTFWQTNFPNAGVSWVFDAATNLWHERTYTNPSTGAEERHRAECHIFHNEQHLVGDYANGNLYELDPDSYSDDSASIARERTYPGARDEGKRIFYSELQVYMEVGVGPEVHLLDGLGNKRSPKAMLSMSKDVGHSYSSERTADIGFVGQRRQRVRWLRLGAARDCILKLRITDPVSVTMTDAWFEAEVGSH